MITINVIIPCRNEVKYLKECVDSIIQAGENIEGIIQIFIVDGLSDDGTLEVIENLKSKFPNVHLIVNEKQLTPYAFNLGIHALPEADYFQIVGARHMISENYLSECVNIIEKNNEVWCVGGRIVNEFINEKGEIISAAMSTKIGMGLGNFRTLKKSGYTDTVTSPMYPKWVFEKIGYFDELLIRNQDDDFNFRVTNAGGKIYYSHEIYLKYYVRGNYSGLWRQFFQYGYWKVFVNKKHKTVTTIRQLAPPIFVLYLIFTLLFSLISLKLSLLFSLLILIYLFIITWESLSISGKLRISFVKVLPVFPILHLSYGLGYLSGIFEFLILRKSPSDKQNRLSR